MIVVRETRGATCMTCWSGYSLAGCTSIRIAVTLSDMSGRYGYGYNYHNACYIYFNYFNGGCFMYVIVYRSKPNI
jgi:hypothetical protein